MTAIICTAASAHPALADIGVTTAARMVDGSDTILVARIDLRGGQPVAIPERVLKGSDPGDTVTLIDPSEGRFLAFNLPSLAEAAKGQPAVILGKRTDGGGTLRLTYLFASVWPQGYRPSTFPSDTVAQNVAFVDRLLTFSRLAAAPDDLVRALHTDIAGRGAATPHAALAYLEVAVERDVKAALQMPVRALGAAAAATHRDLDPAAMEQLANLAPVLPVSVAAPLFLNLAERAPAETAKIMRNALWPMLSARGAAVGPKSTPGELERATAALLPALRRAEATRLLAVYDSGVPGLEGGLGDTILHAVVGHAPDRPLDDLTAAQRRAVWSEAIATLP